MVGDAVYDEIVKYCDARLEAGTAPLAASGRGEGLARADPHPTGVDRVGPRRRCDRPRRSARRPRRRAARAPGRPARARRRRLVARPRPRGAGTCATRSRTWPTPTRWRSTRRPARPASINERAAGAASGEDVTYRGVLRGRRAPGRGRARSGGSRRPMRCTTMFVDDRSQRPGAVGHRHASAVARDGPLDGDVGARARRARGASACRPVDTDRLAHVAWLATARAPLRLLGGRPRTAARAGAGRADVAVGCAVDVRSERRRRTASPARRASTAACSCTAPPGAGAARRRRGRRRRRRARGGQGVPVTERA